MFDQNFRPLREDEQAIIDRLLSVEFQDRDLISKQVEQSMVRRIDENGSLEFKVLVDLSANVQRRIPVEGQIPDADGTLIHILLHVVDHRVKELEIYKDDSSKVIRMPPADELEVIK